MICISCTHTHTHVCVQNKLAKHRRHASILYGILSRTTQKGGEGPKQTKTNQDHPKPTKTNQNQKKIPGGVANFFLLKFVFNRSLILSPIMVIIREIIIKIMQCNAARYPTDITMVQTIITSDLKKHMMRFAYTHLPQQQAGHHSTEHQVLQKHLFFCKQ